MEQSLKYVLIIPALALLLAGCNNNQGMKQTEGGEGYTPFEYGHGLSY